MEDENKKKFKLVLGLGNNSLDQISKLCGIYALAGADIFDLSPNTASVNAAKNGILLAGLNPADFKFCVSIGLKGDKHIRKAEIIEEKCKKCYKCIAKCPQDAIYCKDSLIPIIDWSKCIGCGRCKKSCIKFVDYKADMKKILKDFKHEKIDMVELHISSENERDIVKNWKTLLKHFDCKKSICLDRSKLGDEKLIELVIKLIKMNKEITTLQADGVAMSGSEEIESTLQAIAHAQIYKNIPVEIFISGGTNLYTKKLAESMNLRFEGVTMGSFARNSVKEAMAECDTNKAVQIAQSIVNSVKN